MQTPGHSGRDYGTAVTYNGDRTLIYCHNGDTEDVLDALGLTTKDLFDNPRGSEYRYTGGRVVHRTPEKYFKQTGNTKGTDLYGVDSLDQDGPVYVVEGENDVNTARNVCGVPAVSQAMGASTSPDKADWTGLAGRDVVIVRDDDEPGHKRAARVAAYLEDMTPGPSSVQVVDVTKGKDLSDHIAAGHGLDELVPIAVEDQPRRRITLVPASSVRTERLDWLIDNWVPRRSLTLLAGREGLGKSTIACGIAAQATRGELNAPPMNVAYLNTEDSRSITVKPRLQAAGADLARVFFIDVTTEEGGEGALSLPGDTFLLARALADKGVKLVILDAAKSAMHSSLDGYRDDDVRQFLEPLAAVCDQHDMAVIGLVHFGKRESTDTGKLILGSVAWSQIARSVLSVAVDEEGTLVVTNTKGNLAPAQVSREARLESVTVDTDDGKTTDVGRVVWGDETNVSAADLLVTRDDQDDDERSEIEAVVVDYLINNGGQAPAADVLKACRAAGLNDNAVKKARKKIGVATRKAGMGGGWVWSLESSPKVLFTPEDSPEDSEDTRTRAQESSAPSGESSRELTPVEPPPTNPLRDLLVEPVSLPARWRDVLNVLSVEHGMTLRTITGCFTTKQLVDLADGGLRPDDHRTAVQDILDELEQRGLVHRHNDKYLKSPEGAQAA